MTNRAVLGVGPGGALGLFVSKPGVNVLSPGSDDDMLFSMATLNLQIVQSGRISDPGANVSTTITIPNLGFNPFVIFSCDKYPIQLDFPSVTQIRLTTGNAISFLNDTVSPTNISRTGEIRYAVTNQPIT
jgi:hypothetical protein